MFKIEESGEVCLDLESERDRAKLAEPEFYLSKKITWSLLMRRSQARPTIRGLPWIRAVSFERGYPSDSSFRLSCIAPRYLSILLSCRF